MLVIKFNIKLTSNCVILNVIEKSHQTNFAFEFLFENIFKIQKFEIKIKLNLKILNKIEFKLCYFKVKLKSHTRRNFAFKIPYKYLFNLKTNQKFY